MEGSKKLVPVLYGVITIKFSLYKILTKIPTKEERMNFHKMLKTTFRENFDFRRFIIILTQICTVSFLQHIFYLSTLGNCLISGMFPNSSISVFFYN